jgi:orotidine-5'-phosphate decarboxylase
LKVDVPANPICLAIDSPDRAEIAALAAATRANVGMFKFGLTALYGAGLETIATLDLGRPLFLDAKLHDIPTQVAGAMESLRDQGASFVTVHAAGGGAMIEAAVEAADGRVGVLAVTVLTSLESVDLAPFGSTSSVTDVVTNLAEVALEAGAAGLVCSPHEVAVLRERFGPRRAGGPILVVPGIRPAGERADDQRRTMGPREALESGADILVVGRPISAAPDAAAAAAELAKVVAA